MPQYTKAACRSVGWSDALVDATRFTDDAAARDHRAGVIGETGGVDVVVEATGVPAAGISHARAAFAGGKHIVMVNVEADVLAGPLLAEEAREDHPEGHTAENQRQTNDVAEVQHFGDDHLTHKLRHGRAGRFDQAFFAVTRQGHPILCGHPEEGHQTVEEPSVDELELVHLFEWTVRTEPQDARGINVFVQAFNVGEAVVQDVVLDFPHGRAAADQVEYFANDGIDTLVGAEGAVVGVVHDVQSDASQAEPHDDLGNPKSPAVSGHAECDEPPRHKKCGQHDSGFEVHAPIALA